MLPDPLSRRLALAEREGDAVLDAARNARLIPTAEKRRRAIHHGAAESWNRRDRRVAETL